MQILDESWRMGKNIKSFVRVRPTSNDEKARKSPTVVTVNSNQGIVVCEGPEDEHPQEFIVDKVFGFDTKQSDVYNEVASPLMKEVLAGYNCTLFTYGQTGSGKTYTMEGACNDPSLHWQSESTAGIIPRALSQLFDELTILNTQEYSVTISFLELYNEELFDLLCPDNDGSKIRIYKDTTNKGAMLIHGLKQITIHNNADAHKVLQKDQSVAARIKAHARKSHTVFSITVHIKDNSFDGQELLKTGKFNLVDLAGRENIRRSSTVDRRDREAANINQSLLTLGRVITALVERAPHIPYRESKLTRLLQESLGGSTKTSLIATISPAKMNIEETLFTLDFAQRAKNIINTPTINQKLSKKFVLKYYTQEIERLPIENYSVLQSIIDSQYKEIEEKINRIMTLEAKVQIIEATQSQHKTQIAKSLAIINENFSQNKFNLYEFVNTLLNKIDNVLSSADVITVQTQKFESIESSTIHTIETAKNTLENKVHPLNYKTIRKIGQGGSGIVSLVLCHNQVKALKVVDVKSESHEEVIMREISIMKSLTHPNIVGFHRYWYGIMNEASESAKASSTNSFNPEADEIIKSNANSEESSDDRPFNNYFKQYCILMEYCGGTTLSHWISSNHLYQNHEIIQKIFIQLLDGIRYVHKKKICHGDLKTDNIGCDADFNVKILDFGAAQYYESDSTNRTEGMSGDVLDLGMILMEMVIGPHRHKLKTDQIKAFRLEGKLPDIYLSKSTEYEQILMRAIGGFNGSVPSCTALVELIQQYELKAHSTSSLSRSDGVSLGTSSTSDSPEFFSKYYCG